MSILVWSLGRDWTGRILPFEIARALQIYCKATEKILFSLDADIEIHTFNQETD